MTRRPALLAAALCITLPLSACASNPEAGRPDVTPTSPSPTAASPTASTPSWTAEEVAAIDAAKQRYAAARAALDAALANPSRSSREPLQAAGLGGQWLLDAIEDVRSLRSDGWYRSGSTKISAVTVQSVELEREQPEVRLKACVDSSGTTYRFQKDKKPVPIGATTTRKRYFLAKLVYASAAGQTTKAWYVVEEKGAGPC